VPTQARHSLTAYTHRGLAGTSPHGGHSQRTNCLTQHSARSMHAPLVSTHRHTGCTRWCLGPATGRNAQAIPGHSLASQQERVHTSTRKRALTRQLTRHSADPSQHSPWRRRGRGSPSSAIPTRRHHGKQHAHTLARALRMPTHPSSSIERSSRCTAADTRFDHRRMRVSILSGVRPSLNNTSRSSERSVAVISTATVPESTLAE